MSNDPIGRINSLRSYYKAVATKSDNEVVNALEDVKTEIKILNDENAREEVKITNALNSPYLLDQMSFMPNVVYNSPQETSWKDVKSFEQTKAEIEERFANLNKKKLDII
jgi:hypothetical protein